MLTLDPQLTIPLQRLAYNKPLERYHWPTVDQIIDHLWPTRSRWYITVDQMMDSLAFRGPWTVIVGLQLTK